MGHNHVTTLEAGGTAPQVRPQYAFVLCCPRGNHFPLVIEAVDWPAALGKLADGLVHDVGADARRWYIEHALVSSEGRLEFVERGHFLNEFDSQIERALARAIEASRCAASG